MLNKLSIILLLIASLTQAGNFLSPLPASRAYSGVYETPTATVISDSLGVLSYGYTQGEQRIYGIQSFFNWVELGGMIAGPPGAPGDLSLQLRIARPLYTNKYARLSAGLGGADIGGGAVHNRFYYAVSSLETRFARASIGVRDVKDSTLFSSIEVSPGIPYVRALWTKEEWGFALLAPNWAVFQVGYDHDWHRQSFAVSLTRPLDSIAPKLVARDSSIWNIHYQPSPELFDIIAIEIGPYHYQLLMMHNLFFNSGRNWGGAIQVRQPLKHSTELSEGHPLAKFRKDGVALQQSIAYYRTKWQQFSSELAAGTYEQNWWFWRTTIAWQQGDWSARMRAARFDNPQLKEFRTTWIPELQWQFTERYALRLFGGEFWTQDKGYGASLIKSTGPVTVAFTGVRTYPIATKQPVHLIGASITLPLRFGRDIQIGSPHFTANGPDAWDYGIRTRLVQPGQPNSIGPWLATEPE